MYVLGAKKKSGDSGERVKRRNAAEEGGGRGQRWRRAQRVVKREIWKLVSSATQNSKYIRRAA